MIANVNVWGVTFSGHGFGDHRAWLETELHIHPLWTQTERMLTNRHRDLDGVTSSLVVQKARLNEHQLELLFRLRFGVYSESTCVQKPMLKSFAATSQISQRVATTASTPRIQNCSAIGPLMPAMSVSTEVSPLLQALRITSREAQHGNMKQQIQLQSIPLNDQCTARRRHSCGHRSE